MNMIIVYDRFCHFFCSGSIMLAICIIFSFEYYWLLLHHLAIYPKMLSKAQHNVTYKRLATWQLSRSVVEFKTHSTVSKEIWLVSYERGRLCIFLPSLTSPMTRAAALTNKRSKCSDSYVNMVSAPFRHFPYPASPTTLAVSWIMISQGHT